MECPHCKSKNTDKDFLFETKHWRAFLVSDQCYLGRVIVELQTHKGSLTELTDEELTNFGELVKKYESAVKKSFGADVFNWMCFMNNAYQEENPNPHVHWHVRPRYKNVVVFQGQEFTDPDFGKNYNRDREFIVPDELFQKIKLKIVENL